MYKSWEDEYKGDQKVLYDRLVQGEYVANTMLIGGKIRVGNKIVVPPTMLLPVLKYLHSFSHTGKRKFIEISRGPFPGKGKGQCFRVPLTESTALVSFARAYVVRRAKSRTL